MDDDERAALRAENRDPDDPAVTAALERVTRTLHLYRHLAWTFTAEELDRPVQAFDNHHAYAADCIEHAFE